MKDRISNNLPVNELSVFVFDKTAYANLIWEDEKELRYKEKMYDIVKMDIC